MYLAESLMKNRRVVENALCILRGNRFKLEVPLDADVPSPRYEFQGNELMFLWNLQWWDMVENLANWLQPLNKVV